jgi:hypothetical protein
MNNAKIKRQKAKRESVHTGRLMRDCDETAFEAQGVASNLTLSFCLLPSAICLAVSAD